MSEEFFWQGPDIPTFILVADCIINLFSIQDLKLGHKFCNEFA
jgi:hypothetical protein